MKRALPALAAFALAFAAGAALGGIRLNPAWHYDLTDCDGGVTVNADQAAWFTTVKDEGVWLCTGDAGCATGGQWLPLNTTVVLSYSTPSGGPTPISCRSVSGTGDISMTIQTPGAY